MRNRGVKKRVQV